MAHKVMEPLVSSATEAPLRVAHRIFNYAIQLAFLITLICKIVPLFPRMPGTGLDASWAYALNKAVAQGLAFGRDIIFTFGPYSSVYTKEYNPATVHLMFLGASVLCAAYYLAVLTIIRRSKWYLKLAMWLVVAAFLLSRDALLFSYPLLVGLIICAGLEGRDKKGRNSALAYGAEVLLFIPLGLLPLVKGTALILCLAVLALVIVFLATARQWRLVAIAALVPVCAATVFWVIAGQPLAALPSYLGSMVSITRGYSTAMGIEGKTVEIVVYIAAACGVLAAIWRGNRASRQGTVFLFTLYAVCLFLAFKAGFVRQDISHVHMASESLLFGSVALAVVINTRWAIMAVMLALATNLFIYGKHEHISAVYFAHKSFASHHSALQGLKHQFVDRNWLGNRFEGAVEQIRKAASIPDLKGSTDIYSFNQSQLIASGNHWDPRPVFQSYSAYTPALEAANRRHLTGDRPPDNILFRIEPIDHRLPSLEDGSSWPIILTDYRPVSTIGSFLYLRKAVSHKIATQRVLSRGMYSLGEAVKVNDRASVVFARILIEPSLAGRMVALVYKPSQLRITLTLKDGTTRAYRFIAGMGRSEFLISPLVEDTADFGQLFNARNSGNKRVVSFTITAKRGDAWEWGAPFAVTLKTIPRKDIWAWKASAPTQLSDGT